MLMTRPLLEVARVFLAEPDTLHYARSLAARTGFATGTLSPILERLREAEWIVDVAGEPNPGYPRRYVRLTPLGRAGLAAMLDNDSQRRGKLSVVA